MSEAPVPGDGLAWVAVVVDDPGAAADTLERHFGLPRREAAVGREGRRAPLLGVGRTALALFAPGDPFVDGQQGPGVHHIAVACADPAAAAARARAAGVAPAEERPQPGLDGGSCVALSPAATCGVHTRLATPPERPGPGHDGPVERIDHIGVASADNRAAVGTFTGRLGFALESTQTDMETHVAVESFTSDKYGVVQRTRAPRIAGGLRVAFVTVGDCELEFLQELEPHGDDRMDHGGPGNTRQDYGAISRFVERRGPGLHHLALKVADIDAMLGRLEGAGLRLIDREGRPGSRRARIGFVHPRSLHGLLLHLVQREAP